MSKAFIWIGRKRRAPGSARSSGVWHENDESSARAVGGQTELRFEPEGLRADSVVATGRSEAVQQKAFCKAGALL